MGSQEVLAEARAAALANGGDGDAAGVAANDAVGLTDGVDARHQLALGFQLLDDDLNDPVGLCQAVEVVIGVAQTDAVRDVWGKERSGLSLLDAVPATRNNFHLVWTAGRNVEEVNLIASV